MRRDERMMIYFFDHNTRTTTLQDPRQGARAVVPGAARATRVAPNQDLQGMKLMPCPSIGPKLFWTVQIVLDKYKLF